MYQVTLNNGVVTTTEQLDAGIEVVTVDDAPRVGSVRNGRDGWMASTHAVLVNDDSKVVEQVSKHKWADNQATIDGSTWLDAALDPVVGQIMQEDGSFIDPPLPRNISAEVANHAIDLKVGIVNATRTDGLTDPATADGLAAIMTRYQRITDEFNTDVNLGVDVSEDRKDVVRLIRAGHTFFQDVDTASTTILAAGDAADPIETDPRWPALPSG